jgi:hypothetical protein
MGKWPMPDKVPRPIMLLKMYNPTTTSWHNPRHRDHRRVSRGQVRATIRPAKVRMVTRRAG